MLNYNYINKKHAFTMAEAIIVMTILGIIATIMITNLKPSEFRDKGLQVMAKKNIEQIDQVIQQILNNHSQDGTLEKLYELGTTTTFNFYTESEKADSLFKKYLATTRKGFDANKDGDINIFDVVKIHLKQPNDEFVECISSHLSNISYAYTLKDGTEICIAPEESTTCVTSGALGYLIFDVNGWEQEPNILGKDTFVLPLNEKGIAYDKTCN